MKALIVDSLECSLIFSLENTAIDMNNNNKTKANDSASRQSPRGKSTIDNGAESSRVTSDAGPKQLESEEQLKAQDKNIGIASVIPGMRKLALQEIEHPDGKVFFCTI